jgi:hypothetical protein
MSNILLTAPSYFKEVERRLKSAGWLVHNFPLDSDEGLYNPANYLYNIYFDNVEYRAYVDLNVLQYIINCVKKDYSDELHRDACAMLLFCRLARVSIEPSLAVYERIDYSNGRLDEALKDLEVFYALDSADPDALADYMLGNSIKLEVSPYQIDKEHFSERLTQSQRLKEWDSIYVLVLALVRTYYDKHIDPTRRMAHYINWMARYFRLSQPCLVYAARFFGNAPLRRMMKFKPCSSPQKKYAQLRNMTWDLFHINHYFRSWIDPERHWEELFFSQDQALRDTLRLVIRIQVQQDLDPLLDLLRPREVTECRELLQSSSSRSDRAYGSKNWSPDHRALLIEKLESELGVR